MKGEVLVDWLVPASVGGQDLGLGLGSELE